MTDIGELSGSSRSDELDEVLDEHMIGELAGLRSFQRGVGYLNDRRVESAAASDKGVRATVRGTMPYDVELWLDADTLNWSCSCPAAEDGSFCKHCVAVALSLLRTGERPEGASEPTRPSQRSPSADPDVLLLEGFVHRLDVERLAEIVLQQAADDWRLRERLLLEARSEQGIGPDLDEWRQRIKGVFGARRHVSYHEAPEWAAIVDDMIDAMVDLCDAGHGPAAAQLAEYAHRRADTAMGRVDDSDGWLTVISDRLADLHLQACEQSTSDPVKLAKRLAKLEMTSELDGFHRSAATYAEVLGPSGLTAFRRAIEPQWRQIDPKDDDWSSDVSRLREAMIGWALAMDDPDALIEAHRRDRIHPTDMGEIAAAFERAGRDDEAVEWARRGLSGMRHGSWHAGNTRDFLARKLRERGETEAAVDLYWKTFEASPSLSNFRRLKQEDTGVDWLSRGRKHLLTLLDPSGDNTLLASGAPADGSVPENVMSDGAAAAPAAAAVILTEILLFEGHAQQAWDTAVHLGTSSQMWMTLAREREQRSPRDSITVYASAALAIIDRKKANQYKSAVDLMSRIQRLAADADEPELFDSLLQRVRTEHRAKRRLKELLDRAGW